MQDYKKPMTREERLEYWRLCRIILDHRANRITKQQAFKEFCAYLDMPKALAKPLFDAMRLEKGDSLKRARPDWIGKEPDVTVPWAPTRELRWDRHRKHKKY